MVTATTIIPVHESTVSDFISLLKPGVMSLVVFTGAVGMVLAPGQLNPFQQFMALLCIAMASGAGGAMNMWFDRDIDAIMKRTAKRPVPAGRIAADDALAFGMFLAAVSVMLMGLALNWVAAFILAFAIFFYVGVYTMGLKRRTPQNIVIGGAAGAFPPMIGWAATVGTVSLQPLLLFLIVFLWTPPHFWALALYKNEDYTRAGVPMLPVVAGKAATWRQMLLYTVLLVVATLSLPFLGMAGWFYTAAAALLGGAFLYRVARIGKDASDKWARSTFGFSIFYLFMLFTSMLLDTWVM